MTERSNRWRQVERLCQEALEWPALERAALLRTSCAGDEALLQEVEALLAHEASAEHFLELPAGAAAAAVMGPVTPPLTGRRLGTYEVGELLGVGGMGEVYRARDIKLQRDIAIKILPEPVANDPDRLARFTREARVLAALNHPNIGAIYGLEDAEGRLALALELVEGPTLADLLRRGPLPLDDARAIALQMADALEAAHERGIIHRDLKPANVKARPDGTVKVLDFGLAKALETGAPGATTDQSPTITSPAMTRAGVILGTAAYMSPEQAKGRAADARSDVWAFGAVLYELLSGQRAFKGEDVADTLASVLRADPDWTALPANTPHAVRRLLRRCLQKNPRLRLQAIGDARLELLEVEPSETAAPARAVPPAPRRVWPLLFAAAGGAAAVGIAAWLMAPEPPAMPVSRFSIEGPDSVARAAGGGFSLAVSPDGRTLVYASGGPRLGLVRRHLSDFATEPIRGGEGGTHPFFSPDGAWIGFVGDGKLKKVPVGGGVPVTIADAAPQSRAVWADDGTIVVARPHLYTVSSDGGTLEPLFGPTDGQFYALEMLPGSKTVLVDARRPPNPGYIEAVDLTTRTRRRLLEGAQPRLAPGGELLFVRQGKIWASKFDAERVEVIGTPVPVVESRDFIDGDVGVGAFAISRDGSLMYVAGSTIGSLMWIDRSGTPSPAMTGDFGFRNPRLSPDATRVSAGGVAAADLWVVDFERATRLRLTTEGFNRTSAWSPDSKRIAFFSAPMEPQPGNEQDLYVVPAFGGTPTRLLQRPGPQWADSWSPDGRHLIFDDGPGYSRDLWVLAVGSGESRPLVATRFNERAGMFSPDGDSVAFVSDESGRDEVYVQQFEGAGQKVPISARGGREPVWARNGRELYYREGDALMGVPVQHRPFRAAPPRKLFDLPSGVYGLDPYAPEYDVAPDGRFLAVRRDSATQIHVILNWVEELRSALR